MLYVDLDKRSGGFAGSVCQSFINVFHSLSKVRVVEPQFLRVTKCIASDTTLRALFKIVVGRKLVRSDG